ncbi:MAG: type II toxin-antitoxin system VapC family toxin [Bacteroidota bacterium]
MIRYLLDTNIVSEPTRQRPAPQVQARVEAHAQEAAVASAVWHELLHGLERMPTGRKREFLARYLFSVVRPAMPILSFDADAAEWLARERARLEALGKPRPALGGIVAAIAATRGLILVTRNTGDFEGYQGLHVENWFAS